jgi:hypothetical protein
VGGVSVRIALLPWWGRAAGFGAYTVICAAIVLALLRLQGHPSLTSPVVITVVAGAALLVGALIGVFMGWSSWINSYRDAIGPLGSPAQRSQAMTAVWRGPIRRIRGSGRLR